MAVAICDPVGDHDSERMLGARLDGRPADSEKMTGLSGLKVGAKLSFLSGREVLGAAAMGAGMVDSAGSCSDSGLLQMHCARVGMRKVRVLWELGIRIGGREPRHVHV